MPLAPGPRRNCYTICRPWYCAGFLFPQARPRCCRGCGDRGCVTGDHLTIDVLRYPGSDVRPGDPDGAWLLRFFPLGVNHLPTAGTALLRTAGDANCLVACCSATLRQPAPSPVLRLLWLRTPLPNSRCARPQPTPSPGCCSLTSLLSTANCTYRTAVLLTAAPDHCGPPGPGRQPRHRLAQPGFGTPPPNRPAYCWYCWSAVRLCQTSLISATRETIPTPPPNVYSGRHRFSRAR